MNIHRTFYVLHLDQFELRGSKKCAYLIQTSWHDIDKDLRAMQANTVNACMVPNSSISFPSFEVCKNSFCQLPNCPLNILKNYKTVVVRLTKK